MDCETVGKLRDQLAKLPANARIVVAWETDDRILYFGIDDVSMHRGTPSRDSKGEVGFSFDRTGSANWAFASITPE